MSFHDSLVSYDTHVVLDFEATCQKEGKPSPQEIIEFPSVAIDPVTLNVISEFQRYVKPVHHPTLSLFCTELTGITQAMVDSGYDLPSTVKAYNKWLSGHLNPIIITCGNWDLDIMLPNQYKTSVLGKQPTHFRRWINIMDEFRRFYRMRPRGMVGMLEQLNIVLLGRHHSGIDDCRNIVKVWQRMLTDGYLISQQSIHYTRT